MRRAAALGTIPLTLLLAACGGGEARPQAQPSPTPTSPAPTSAAPDSAAPSPTPSPSKSTPPGTSKPPAKTLHLTFDDGPDPVWTPQVLDVLKQHNAKATFFIIGDRARQYPALIERIHNEGHVLANHTWQHKDLTKTDAKGVGDALTKTRDVLGANASTCMRPPFGALNQNVRDRSKALGLKVVLWDVDPKDWSRPGVQKITDRVLSKARPGATVLFHDGNGDLPSAAGSDRAQTVAALRALLPKLADQGYGFTAVCG